MIDTPIALSLECIALGLGWERTAHVGVEGRVAFVISAGCCYVIWRVDIRVLTLTLLLCFYCHLRILFSLLISWFFFTTEV
ncbi:hypothetical protein BT63DRAFT_205744 [Microthyrium microscopicum]|uniref:Uncharacterized protein n=1 Tax=Microthyrium microscopicum TaxID=703497 RepID=A0A6A6UIW1_9PEZI|nr:hypothetical protein BT63DRAFT_205744 [Microthyrium microscopicum]